MRIESSVTSLSWIPSEAITGVTRIPFDRGITHYDDPPPDQWQDLAAVVGPEGARFANELRAWVEVQDGKIVACGQTGAGRVSSTLASIGGMHVLVEAVGYPLLRQETGTGTDFVRFAQTAGGRPGVPVGASAFPRHWIYGADGEAGRQVSPDRLPHLVPDRGPGAIAVGRSRACRPGGGRGNTARAAAVNGHHARRPEAQAGDGAAGHDDHG